MPTPTSYVYSSITATIPSGMVDVARLQKEIELSAIVTQIDLNAGGITAPGDNTLTIWFKDPLSAVDKTILDGSSSQTPNSPASAGSILFLHSGLPLPEESLPVTVTNTPAATTNNSAIPNSSILIGGSDGTNLQALRVFDSDTGAGTQYLLGTSLRKSASGGSVEFGTQTDPIRIDPTGTTTQPISASTLPLPTGAATETTLASVLKTTDFQARINTLGQKTMANSTPVVISSDQSTLAVSASTLPLPTGAATETTLASVLKTTDFLARINTLGQKTMANSTPVVISSDQSTLTVTGTVTANIGTSGSLALNSTLTDGTQRSRLTDGTNNVSVKAASTAAVATDPALVVAVSPNNAVAVTQSGAWSNTVTQATASNLNATVVGLGTAGSPSGGVLSIQGVAGGQAVPITGAITATNPSVSTNNTAVPSSSTLIGGSDGTNLQAVRLFDGDTGAGTQYLLGASLRKSASGGSVELGTSTDPIRIDPTGTTTQPISASTLPLPTGAATETTLASVLKTTDFQARVNTLGQKTMANSTPVVISSDQSALTVTANIGTSGSLALNSTLTDGTQRSRLTDGTTNVAVKAASTAAVATDPALVVAVSPNNTISVAMGAGGYGGQVEGRAADNTAAVGNPVLVGGIDGSTVRNVLVDSLGRIIIAPAGSSSAVTPGLAPGYVATAALTRVAVRSTTYTEQTTNAQRSVVSASANDTAAGTGARSVRITYYTATFTGPFTTDVTLNGTTAVNTSVSDICYIEKMEVLTVGSGGQNAGIISLRTTTGGGGSTFASIAVGDNETFYAHHYVATGITTYVTGLSVGHNGTVVGSGGLFIIRARSLNVANAVDNQIGDFVRLYGQSSTISRVWGTALKVPGPARITVLVTPESTSALQYRASIDFYDQ